MLLIYITCRDKAETEKISKYLVNKKLCACTNYFPINSMYFWDNELKNDNEFVLIAKTTEDKFDLLQKKVKELHSYDIPCILKFKVETNKEYDDWVNAYLK